jgi:signal transduction histidine kinase
MMPPDDALIAARMRALTQLARPTLHELRGALSALQIHLELLAGALEGDDEAARASRQRYIAVLREEAARFLRISEAFIGLAALPPSSEPTDASVLVTAVVEATRPLAVARRVRLQGSAPATIVGAVLDPETGRQRLLDALVNALAAAQQGSAVSVTLAADGRSVTIQDEAGTSTIVPLDND